MERELNERWPETDIDPTLERVAMVMDVLGEPQKTYKVIHVAGTNGKTSAVRMTESLLRALGHRVGRTTSPHLQTITERIAVDGVPLHRLTSCASTTKSRPPWRWSTSAAGRS